MKTRAITYLRYEILADSWLKAGVPYNLWLLYIKAPFGVQRAVEKIFWPQYEYNVNKPETRESQEWASPTISEITQLLSEDKDGS